MASLLQRLPALIRSLLLPWNVTLVSAMGFVGSAVGVGLYAVVTSPVFRDRLSIDVTVLGLAAAAGSATGICGLLFWGSAADRLGRRPVLLIGAAGGPPLALWLLVMTSGPELVLRSFLGGFFGAGSMIAPALIADSAPLHRRAQSMATWGASSVAGIGVGFFAASALFGAIGLERTLLFLSLGGLVPIVLALLLREAPPESPAGGFLGQVVSTLRERTMRTLFAVTIFVFLPITGVGVALLPFLQDPPPRGLGLLLEQIPWALAPAALAGFLVFIPAVWRTDKTLRRRPYILAGSALAGVPWLLLPWAGGWTGLALLAATIAAGAALAGPALLGLMADIMPPAHRGSGWGLLWFAINLSFIFGAPLGGFLYDRFGFATAFYALALAAVPGHLLALRRRNLLMPN